MASAFVQNIRPVRNGGNQCIVTATCFFWGTELSGDINGTPQELTFTIGLNYSLADLKAALVQAVQDQATALGFSVAAADINLTSYETG